MTGAALPAALRQMRRSGDLLARSEIACVTLLLTWQCPAQCGHCVFESGPQRREVLDPGLAERMLSAAARQARPPAVSFSGGEPFLAFDTMLRLATLARTLGCPTEVVTSCAWATTAAVARARMEALAATGLRTICVSWDRFHAPYVRAQRVASVIMEARALGLRTVVNTAIDPLRKEAPADYLARTLELPADVLAGCVVNPLNVVPVGRARSNAVELYYPPQGGNGPCAVATEVLTLTPTGLLYPCCGSVVGELASNSGFYALDDLSRMTVDELQVAIREVKENLFFRLLQAAGPAKLVALLQEREPALRIRSRFNSDCDACLELNRNAAAGPALHALLRELAATLGRESIVETEPCN